MTPQKLLSEEDQLNVVAHHVAKHHGQGLDTVKWFNDLWEMGCYQEHIIELIRAAKKLYHAEKKVPQVAIPPERIPIVHQMMALVRTSDKNFKELAAMIEEHKHWMLLDEYHDSISRIRDEWQAANPVEK